MLNDGGEVDLDLGNYERYLDVTLSRDNNITTGKIYSQVIEKEVRAMSVISVRTTEDACSAGEIISERLFRSVADQRMCLRACMFPQVQRLTAH